MSEQILFFKKSKCDFSDTNVVATASEGSPYAANVLNRSNLSAWVTSGSTDASNTTLTIDMVDSKILTDLLLIQHNFKSFNAKYWDGSTYQDFSPAVSETVNTAVTNHYVFAEVATTKIQVTILGTQVPNEDKFLYQLIATEQLGQLDGWPIIKAPIHSRNRIKNRTLSGKLNVVENVGGFSCTLSVKALGNDADLTLFENLYQANEGFLVWLSGGDETQFKTIRIGYRLEDLYLMKCTDEYTPEYYGGLYLSGIKVEMKLEEVID